MTYLIGKRDRGDEPNKLLSTSATNDSLSMPAPPVSRLPGES